MRILFFVILTILKVTQAWAHEDWNLKEFTVETRSDSVVIKQDEKSNPYLAIELRPGSVQSIFEKIDNASYRVLKHDAESNLTLVSPLEFKDDLSHFMTMEEIAGLAKNFNIQKSSLKPVCIGKGTLHQSPHDLETYFIVIDSPDLLRIRQEIAKLYQSRSGKDFDPSKMSPYITLGYSDRDLSEIDGITKDKSTCLKTLHISSLPSQIRGLPIPNSSYVDLNSKGGALIRGNAPLNHKNLQTLKDFGIKDVIIFKNDKAGEVQNEINEFHTLGFSSQSVTHIDFDWKDNQNFTSGCSKIVHGIELMKNAMKENRKLFFHCTTGEDRTGVLAASYLLSQTNLPLKTLFKSEMCGKGYEAGDPSKEKVVVEKIRSGLTQTFLKTAFRIEEAKKRHIPLSQDICKLDPANDSNFIKYSSLMKFTCGESLELTSQK